MHELICNDSPPSILIGTASALVTACTDAEFVLIEDLPLQPMSLDNFQTVAPSTLQLFAICLGYLWLRKIIWRKSS